MSNPLFGSDSDSSYASSAEEEEEASPRAGGKSKGDKTKGGAAMSLLDDVMSGIEVPIYAPEPEPEPEPVAVSPARKRDPNRKPKKDAAEMMRNLKQKQNADEKARTDAKAAAEKAATKIDLSDCGPFGKTSGRAHAESVAGFVRMKVESPLSEGVVVQAVLASEAGDFCTIVSYLTPAETGRFSAQQLMGEPGKLPTGVNPRRREQYLLEADFENVFATRRELFTGLPKWQRDKIKKSVNML